MSLCSWVNVVVGKMTGINRTAKYVVVSKEKKVPYDYLVLCTGQKYQVRRCAQQKAVPRSVGAVNRISPVGREARGPGQGVTRERAALRVVGCSVSGRLRNLELTRVLQFPPSHVSAQYQLWSKAASVFASTAIKPAEESARLTCGPSHRRLNSSWSDTIWPSFGDGENSLSS